MPTDLDALAPDKTCLARHTDAVRSDVLGRIGAPPRPRVWPAAALVSGVVALLVVGSAVVLHRPTPAPHALDPAPAPAYTRYGAFSVAHTLFIGNRRLRFADPIKALYYTSAGVIVRHGTSTLVRPDGRLSRVVLPDLSDRVLGTSPASPLLAYAAPDGKDRWQLNVVDVLSGENRGVVVDGAFTWGGWMAPPVSTDGAHVWALLDAGWVEWDVESGQTRTVDRPAGTATPLEAGGGLYLEETKTQVRVRDFVTGTVLGTTPVPAPTEEVTLGSIAPDGSSFRYGETYAQYDENGHLTTPHRNGILLDLVSGHRSRLPAVGLGWGWTPDGNAIAVDPAQDLLTLCSAASGRCRTVHRAMPHNGRVIMGGASHDS